MPKYENRENKRTLMHSSLCSESNIKTFSRQITYINNNNPKPNYIYRNKYSMIISPFYGFYVKPNIQSIGRTATR